jgi:hypothetical protein
MLLGLLIGGWIMAKKNDSGKSYELLQSFASKAKIELEKMLKVIGEEANLSSQFLKGKIDILGINTEIEKKYRELGKEAYLLISEGKLNDSKLKAVALELDQLYSKVDQRRKNIDKLKDQIKKSSPLTKKKA